MKLSAEFLQGLPALPSNDFNKVDQSCFYHVKGRYFNSPVSDEIDGCLVNIKRVGKWDIQQLFLTEGEYSYERVGQRSWERKVIAHDKVVMPS